MQSFAKQLLEKVLITVFSNTLVEKHQLNNSRYIICFITLTLASYNIFSFDSYKCENTPSLKLMITLVMKQLSKIQSSVLLKCF